MHSLIQRLRWMKWMPKFFALACCLHSAFFLSYRLCFSAAEVTAGAPTMTEPSAAAIIEAMIFDIAMLLSIDVWSLCLGLGKRSNSAKPLARASSSVSKDSAEVWNKVSFVIDVPTKSADV